jgi:hypothetical protein
MMPTEERVRAVRAAYWALRALDETEADFPQGRLAKTKLARWLKDVRHETAERPLAKVHHLELVR